MPLRNPLELRRNVHLIDPWPVVAQGLHYPCWISNVFCSLLQMRFFSFFFPFLWDVRVLTSCWAVRRLKKFHNFMGNWIKLTLCMNLKEAVLKSQGSVEQICWSLLSHHCRSHRSLQAARLCTRASCVAKALGSLAFRDLVNFLWFLLFPSIAES